MGSDLNITLEFRTSSENGVLLGISSAKVDAIGLEIVSGQVRVGPTGPLIQMQQCNAAAAPRLKLAPLEWSPQKGLLYIGFSYHCAQCSTC